MSERAELLGNFFIRLVGTGVVLFLIFRYLPGFYTVDLFTLIAMPIIIAIILLPVRSLILLQTFHLTPVTVGVPLFTLTTIVIYFLSHTFPGFALTNWWGIFVASFAVATVHYLSEQCVHHQYH